ncbi:glycosyltransferase [Paenibacillus sp. N4]|uniref:glycosyltransferase family 2 protein n=1 Tax=Paenibacillus vietnamensis TaxID=2590547 RepID=UPI001CD050F4|nr:glycosyltransferase [Paenibacillus vietnamensis]MCA0754993.1 glycosyltransferase [Paenibacillus vietnamensis]
MRRNKKEPQRLANNKPELPSDLSKRMEHYNRALNDGYQEGFEYGYKSFERHFDGTSIIIPCYNELKSVRSCIEAIMSHTDSAYEIIVVDNHSQDGTAHYLKQLDGVVRYHILPGHYGFAGAANRGLMMAKGTTLLLLDHHAVVTDKWLDNMLRCLESDPDGGMVGAVSNGLEGVQHFDMSFKSIESMQKFASWNNNGDPARWGTADKLSLKCLLFKRDLLDKVGFLDEGFREERAAEEDFCIRARLQGYSLAYAGDAFVHFDAQDKETAEQDVAGTDIPDSIHYTDKWIKPKEVLYRYAGKTALSRSDSGKPESPQAKLSGVTAYYPQAIAVKGLTDTIFWIENGLRRPVEGIWDGTVFQVSQLDLRQWKIGSVLKEAESQLKLNLIQGHSGPGVWHGCVSSSSNGDMYYLENGTKRAILSPLAAKAWKLNSRRTVSLTDEELQAIPDGLPIIAPVRLRQAL